MKEGDFLRFRQGTIDTIPFHHLTFGFDGEGIAGATRRNQLVPQSGFRAFQPMEGKRSFHAQQFPTVPCEAI
jgi:hypothetical protein